MAARQTPSAGILVVDDSIENLRVLSRLLATRGFDVRPAATGREALLAVANDPPDLVLLDVTMPEMDGFEVCARLKENPDWREIPVIFLTALDGVDDKLRGFAAGAVDYVTKPFQIEEVLARVENHLALRQARRQLAQSLERLRQVERLRDDLVHMVVHDMRSPLSVLILRLERLSARVGDEHKKGADKALSTARSLNQMANTLLDVSRLEAGKMPLQRSACDVARLAAEVRDSLSLMDPSRTIELQAAGPATVTCDEGLVRRVIENLVSNGVKHTPQGGRLGIRITSSGDRTRVSVKDEGPGVPPEARQRIFEKFSAAAVRKARAYHSAGLGLAFCKLAVQAHGGAIGVDPGTPSGSVFWFELPS